MSLYTVIRILAIERGDSRYSGCIKSSSEWALIEEIAAGAGFASGRQAIDRNLCPDVEAQVEQQAALSSNAASGRVTPCHGHLRVFLVAPF